MKKNNNSNNLKVKVTYTNALGMHVQVKKKISSNELKDKLENKEFTLDKIIA